ncbi:MAG: serine hydrolase [Ruminococcus sp.]|nr:serine hydrolase [Ruminococcus sp.]
MKRLSRITSVLLSLILICSVCAVSIQAKAKNYVKSISIVKKATITIPYNKKTASKTFKVTVKVSGRASKKFTVKSNKTSVATAKAVSGSKVKVTAKKAGIAKIIVTTKAKGIRKKKLKKTLTVTVKKAKKTMPAVTPTEPQTQPTETQPTEAQPTEPQPTEPKDYQSMIKKKMESLGFGGVIRVSKNGEVVCNAASGNLSLFKDEPITVDNQFAIGSVSKQFTAACVMLLRDDGKLSVNDTIDKWFPEYKYSKDITVKMLLTMRSGIRDYVNSPDSEEEYYSRYVFGDEASGEENRKATLDWIFSKELDFEPDTKIAYSNSNYALLAEIVEKVSGTSYSSFLREKIFDPLEMNDTGMYEDFKGYDNLAPPASAGYPIEIYTKGIAFGDGNLISTTADMDKWMTSLREYTVLKKETVDEMMTNYSPKSSMSYGYGFFVAKDGSFWHEGAIDSYYSSEYSLPAKKYNLFAATNNDDLDKLKALVNYARTIIK